MFFSIHLITTIQSFNINKRLNENLLASIIYLLILFNLLTNHAIDVHNQIPITFFSIFQQVFSTLTLFLSVPFIVKFLSSLDKAQFI